MEKPDILFRQFTICLVLITVFVSGIFVVFPQLDLFISGFFAAPEGGFPLSESPALNIIRSVLIYGMWIFLLSAMLSFLASLVLRSARLVPLRIWAFPVVVSVCGPLLLVNSVLKSYWGRARPYTIIEFGGASEFSPAYVISDQCVTNCSFTSGEGAAIATVTIVIGVLLWRNVERRWRLASVLTVLYFIGAGLRVIKGQHFISDTVLSALFCALIAIFFYWLFDIGAHRYKLTWANVKTDLRNLGRNHPRFRNSDKK